MSLCFLKMGKMLSLPGLAILGLMLLNGLVIAKEVEQTSPTVTLDRPLHFLSPEGRDVILLPGSFRIEKEQENVLRIVSMDREEKYVVQSEGTIHQDELTAPIAFWAEGEWEDQQFLVYLTPGGQGMQAQGSFSGVRERGLSFGKTLSFQWNLTVKITGTWGGNVSGHGINCGTGGPCSKSFPGGSRVILRATATHSEERFLGWTGCDMAIKEKCTVEMKANRVVTAKFWLPTHTLTIKKIGGGIVTGPQIRCEGGVFNHQTCEAIFLKNSVVKFSASSSQNYWKIIWEGCTSTLGTNPDRRECEVRMDQNRSVQATFRILQPLRVDIIGRGTVTVPTGDGNQTCTSSCTVEVAISSHPWLVAQPANGFKFESWTGCDQIDGNRCHTPVITDPNHSVTAKFTSVTPNGRLRIQNATSNPWQLLSIKIDNVEHLSLSNPIANGSRYETEVPVGTHQVEVLTGRLSNNNYEPVWDPLRRTVTINSENQLVTVNVTNPPIAHILSNEAFNELRNLSVPARWEARATSPQGEQVMYHFVFESNGRWRWYRNNVEVTEGAEPAISAVSCCGEQIRFNFNMLCTVNNTPCQYPTYPSSNLLQPVGTNRWDKFSIQHGHFPTGIAGAPPIVMEYYRK